MNKVKYIISLSGRPFERIIIRKTNRHSHLMCFVRRNLGYLNTWCVIFCNGYVVDNFHSEYRAIRYAINSYKDLDKEHNSSQLSLV